MKRLLFAVFTVLTLLIVIVACKNNSGAALEVAGTAPADGSDDADLDTIISAVFAEGIIIDKATITADSFYLFDNTAGLKIVAIQGIDGNTLKLTPSASLSKNTDYTGTVTHEVMDETGASLEETYTWKFRTIAAVGELDSTFGNGGIVQKQFSALNDTVTAVKVLDSDKILVAGYASGATTGADVLLVRLMPDGSLDAKFGPAGQGVLSFSSSTKDEVIFSIDTQSNGRIIGGGFIVPSAGSERDSYLTGVW